MLIGMLVAIITTLGILGLGVALEALQPVGRRIGRTLVFNLLYASAFIVWARLLQPIADAESAFVKSRLGISQIPLPEHGWSVLMSATVLMFAEDLIFYWVHRAQHRSEFLWAMHSF